MTDLQKYSLQLQIDRLAKVNVMELYLGSKPTIDQTFINEHNKKTQDISAQLREISQWLTMIKKEV